MAKLVFVFVCFLVIFQMVQWGVAVPRVARDAQEKNVTEVLNEAFQSFRNSLDDLVKQIETNELYQNISAQVKQFGENVKVQGQKVLEKVQNQAGS